MPPSTALVLGCQSFCQTDYWIFPLINSQFCLFMSWLIIYKPLMGRENISLPSILRWCCWMCRLSGRWAPWGGGRWTASRAPQRGNPQEQRALQRWPGQLTDVLRPAREG